MAKMTKERALTIRTTWVDAIAASARIGVSRRTVYRLIDEGQFTVRRAGKTWRLDLSSVEAYIARNTTTASHELHLTP